MKFSTYEIIIIIIIIFFTATENCEDRSVDQARNHHCDECSKYFRRSSNLKRHKQLVHLKLPHLKSKYRCCMCNKGLAQFSHLKEHTVTHLDPKLVLKEFKCDTCGKEFTKKSNLTQHKRCHLDPKLVSNKFKCVTCGKEFIRKGNLNQHIRWHVDPLTWKMSRRKALERKWAQKTNCS